MKLLLIAATVVSLLEAHHKGGHDDDGDEQEEVQYFTKECLVSHGKPLTILPTWGPEFHLSFELYINTFKNMSFKNMTSMYAEILRFTSTNCSYVFDGFPGVDATEFGHVTISTQIGRGGFYGFYFYDKPPVKRWSSIEISQFRKYSMDTKVKLSASPGPVFSSPDSI